MPKQSVKCPPSALVIKTYVEFEELVSAFVAGHLPLLVIMGRPGLSKSQSIKRAIGDAVALYLKGRKSEIDFYIDAYFYRDKPIILDDPDNMLSQKLFREYLKALTETDQYKRLDYGTKTKILDNERVPKHFWTTSHVCIITNSWNSSDPILQAIESRAEFIYFDPDWTEVYRQAGTWFWDQEIYDYVYERLGVLRQPDCRLFVRAYNRKKGGMSSLNWKQLIDSYCDDEIGLTVRKLVDDESFETNTARAKAFCELTGADRSTFYRRMKEIRRYRPTNAVEQIILQRRVPPNQQRPADGQVPEIGDDDDE